MAAPHFTRVLPRIGWFSSGLLAVGLLGMSTVPVSAQPVEPTIQSEPEAPEEPAEDPAAAPEFPPIETPEPTDEDLEELESVPDAPSSVTRADGGFTIAVADQLVAEAEEAISVQDYDAAIAKLREARELYNQMSTYYQDLAAMFVGVDTRLNTSNREKALETAQRRDRATYQLALIYRVQERADLAVPLLMEILRSQQPTRSLGQRAYQQLFELGFVDSPYPADGEG